MESLKINESEDCPQVTLDQNNNIFEISGRSLPEDVNTFYGPVLEWIEEYSKNPDPKTIFTFKLTYFNTASSKIILDILTLLERLVENGHDALVKWYYPKSDEDMQEAGQEYSLLVNVPFEHIGY